MNHCREGVLGDDRMNHCWGSGGTTGRTITGGSGRQQDEPLSGGGVGRRQDEPLLGGVRERPENCHWE